MSDLTYLSLFSGIGGLDLGLDRAGWTCVGQVEKDPFCQRVLAKRWPEVPRHDDVRTAPEWWTNLGRPAPDLVAGGFPCQPFSLAGRRAGVADERWGWPWFWDVVRMARPRYVLVENVAALLRDRDAWGIILADLAAGGYDADWDCIPAAAVGAPHRRDRVFLVAHAQCDAIRLEPVAEPGRRRSAVAGHHGPHGRMADASRGGRNEQHDLPATSGRYSIPDADRGCEDVADTVGMAGSPTVTRRVFADSPARGGVDGIDGRRWSGGEQWSAEPDVGRVAHGIPARVDRLRGLGNAVVPQVAEHVGRLIREHAELARAGAS